MLTVQHSPEKLLYVKETLKFTIMNDISIMLNDCENLWILIKTEQKRLVFGVTYLYPINIVEHITFFEKNRGDIFHKLI